MFKIIRAMFRRYSFEKAEIKAEAQRRNEEIKQLQHTERLLEHQRKIAIQKHKINTLQDQIRFYEDDMAEEYEDEEPKDNVLENLMMGLLNKSLGLNNPQISIPQINEKQNPPKKASLKDSDPLAVASLEDSEILSLLSSVPNQYVELAKTLPEKTVKEYIRNKFNYDEDTVNRAYFLLKHNI